MSSAFWINYVHINAFYFNSVLDRLQRATVYSYEADNETFNKQRKVSWLIEILRYYGEIQEK